MTFIGSQRAARISLIANLADRMARARRLLIGSDDHALARRAAGNVFLIRVGGAVLTYL
ncbi:MAG: hypothetical protein HY659_14200, partial [Rhizobiales bacterium]|nr:hypothetical protein [Hyphomicrobiales bacterium]